MSSWKLKPPHGYRKKQVLRLLRKNTTAEFYQTSTTLQQSSCTTTNNTNSSKRGKKNMNKKKQQIPTWTGNTKGEKGGRGDRDGWKMDQSGRENEETNGWKMEQKFHSFITAILGCSSSNYWSLFKTQTKITHSHTNGWQLDQRGERELATNGWKRGQNFIPLLV